MTVPRLIRAYLLAALGIAGASANSIFITTEGPEAIARWQVLWSDGVQIYRMVPYQVFGTDITISPTSFVPVVSWNAPDPPVAAYQYQVFVAIPGVDPNSYSEWYGVPLRFSLGDYSGWNGVWHANLTFVLPPDAINVRLNIHSFWADDRSVLYLNERPIADQLVKRDGAPLHGPGALNTAFNGEDVQFHVFTNAGYYAVNDQSLFNIGGVNTLKAIINNTGMGGLDERAYSFRSTEDRTSLRLNATVEFDLALSEPSSLAIAALGLVALGWRHRRLGRYRIR